MIRYYRWAATADASYEAMRAGADLSLGLAAPLTSVEAAASAPRDQQSRILLAIDDATAVYAALVGLQGMLASGSVREITAAEYVSSFAAVAATGGDATAALRARRFAWVSPNSYTGVAAYGSAESASAWTIRRTTLSVAGAVTATATAANVRWTDRLTASYS